VAAKLLSAQIFLLDLFSVIKTKHAYQQTRCRDPGLNFVNKGRKLITSGSPSSKVCTFAFSRVQILGQKASPTAGALRLPFKHSVRGWQALC
jgi:hypothetical protein